MCFLEQLIYVEIPIDGDISDLLQIFCFSYQHGNGQMRLRVTTLSRRWIAGPGSIQASSAVTLHHLNANFVFCIASNYLSCP